MATMTAPAKGANMPPLTKKQQIIDDLIGQIRSGDLPPGAQLPTSRELVARYGTSLVPIRSAIDNLKTMGYLVTLHGKGTFVADHPPV